jgi:hypothetical protein
MALKRFVMNEHLDVVLEADQGDFFIHRSSGFDITGNNIHAEIVKGPPFGKKQGNLHLLGRVDTQQAQSFNQHYSNVLGQ